MDHGQKESSSGSGKDEGGSLAGKESAIVLSSIFSRFASVSPELTILSSGSRLVESDGIGIGVWLLSTAQLHYLLKIEFTVAVLMPSNWGTISSSLHPNRLSLCPPSFQLTG